MSSTRPHAKIDIRRFKGIGWGRGEVATSRACLFGSVYRAVHRTWLDAQCTAKCVLVVNIFLGYHFVSRVNRPPPHSYSKNRILGASPA